MIEIFTQTPWQMTLGERAALEGVLASLAPRVAIEIGTAEGGSLRRIAAHSARVHSFDLVEPALPVREWGDVTLHTGDSHALLPAFLDELAAAGTNVDFVLVDGDHSADGVHRDLEDLLASPAIGRTAILVHDTANDEVRRGVERVPYDDLEHVVHHDLDFVPGHLSHGGPYHLQLWGGLGLLLVDRQAAAAPDGATPSFFAIPELLVPLRDALAAHEAAGGTVAPGAVPAVAVPADAAPVAPSAPAGGTEPLEAELARTRAALAAVETSRSWRATAPLRAAADAVRARRAGRR